jgi:hypothetical protein
VAAERACDRSGTARRGWGPGGGRRARAQLPRFRSTFTDVPAGAPPAAPRRPPPPPAAPRRPPPPVPSLPIPRGRPGRATAAGRERARPGERAPGLQTTRPALAAGPCLRPATPSPYPPLAPHRCPALCARRLIGSKPHSCRCLFTPTSRGPQRSSAAASLAAARARAGRAPPPPAAAAAAARGARPNSCSTPAARGPALLLCATAAAESAHAPPPPPLLLLFASLPPTLAWLGWRGPQLLLLLLLVVVVPVPVLLPAARTGPHKGVGAAQAAGGGAPAALQHRLRVAKGAAAPGSPGTPPLTLPLPPPLPAACSAPPRRRRCGPPAAAAAAAAARTVAAGTAGRGPLASPGPAAAPPRSPPPAPPPPAAAWCRCSSAFTLRRTRPLRPSSAAAVAAAHEAEWMRPLSTMRRTSWGRGGCRASGVLVPRRPGNRAVRGAWVGRGRRRRLPEALPAAPARPSPGPARGWGPPGARPCPPGAPAAGGGRGWVRRAGVGGGASRRRGPFAGVPLLSGRKAARCSLNFPAPAPQTGPTCCGGSDMTRWVSPTTKSGRRLIFTKVETRSWGGMGDQGVCRRWRAGRRIESGGRGSERSGAAGAVAFAVTRPVWAGRRPAAPPLAPPTEVLKQRAPLSSVVIPCSPRRSWCGGRGAGGGVVERAMGTRRRGWGGMLPLPSLPRPPPPSPTHHPQQTIEGGVDVHRRVGQPVGRTVALPGAGREAGWGGPGLVYRGELGCRRRCRHPAGARASLGVGQTSGAPVKRASNPPKKPHRGTACSSNSSNPRSRVVARTKCLDIDASALLEPPTRPRPPRRKSSWLMTISESPWGGWGGRRRGAAVERDGPA